jgi:hypothetical protein
MPGVTRDELVGVQSLEAASERAPFSAANIGQFRGAIGTLDQRLLQLTCEGGIGAGGVDDGTGWDVDFTAGFGTT